jgi:mannosyltransferase OCH1-like enzyme
MIPKKIFQTYKTDYNNLSNIQKAMTQTWIDKNPGYEYHYYSDYDIEQFILSHYGKEWHELFLTVKYPVMKADIFRILVLYKYGGFYADLDTECVTPMDSVVENTHTALIANWAHYEMCHWFFGFEAGHPLLEEAIRSLKYMLNSANFDHYKDNNYSRHMKELPHGHQRQNQIYRYVQDITGPMWWTNEIKKYLGLWHILDLMEIERGQLQDRAKDHLESTKILVLPRDAVSEEGTVISHKFASDQPAFGDQYESWSQTY